MKINTEISTSFVEGSSAPPEQAQALVRQVEDDLRAWVEEYKQFGTGLVQAANWWYSFGQFAQRLFQAWCIVWVAICGMFIAGDETMRTSTFCLGLGAIGVLGGLRMAAAWMLRKRVDELDAHGSDQGFRNWIALFKPDLPPGLSVGVTVERMDPISRNQERKDDVRSEERTGSVA